MPLIPAFRDTARGSANDLNPSLWSYSTIRTNGAVYRDNGWNVLQGGVTGQRISAAIQTGQTDAEVVFTAKLAGAVSGAATYRLVMRGALDLLGTNSDTPSTGYGVVISNDGTIALHKLAGATAPTVLGMTSGVAPDTAFKVRFQCVGTALKLRVWAGATEPTTWDINVTDASYTTGGIFWTSYRQYTTSQKLHFQDFDLFVGARTDSNGKGFVPATPACKLERHPSGQGYLPFGSSVTSFVDDGASATMASWLTTSSSTASQDAATWRRRMDVAGNTYGRFIGPAIPTAGVKAIWFSINSLILGATSGLQLNFSLVNSASASYTLRSLATDSVGTLESTVTGNIASKATQLPIVGNEAVKPRNLTIVLLPVKQQLIGLLGDSVLGFVDLPTGVTESLTPYLTLRTTTSTASFLTYRQLSVYVETI